MPENNSAEQAAAEQAAAEQAAAEQAAAEQAAADKAAADKAAADKAAADQTGGNPIVVVGGASQGSERVQIVTGGDIQAVTELPLAPVQKAGYKLAIFILVIISVFLIFLMIILFNKTFDASDRINLSVANVSDSSFVHQKDLIKSLQEEKKNYRDFIISLSQMILLNLLLPTLTAILGYIFGSREGATAPKRNDSGAT